MARVSPEKKEGEEEEEDKKEGDVQEEKDKTYSTLYIRFNITVSILIASLWMPL